MKLLSLLPQLMVTLAAFLMVLLAKYLQHDEIMLPSLGALLTGTWLVKTNLWHYSKLKLFVSLPLAATIGLLLSLFIASASYAFVCPSIYIAFLITASILIVGRTQIYPCFGAAILPVLLQTTSWFYPLSVLIIAIVLCLGRALLERLHVLSSLSETEFSDFPKHKRERAAHYLQASFGLLPVLFLVACVSEQDMLLAPMFVTYATFCNHHSTFTNYPFQTWLQLFIAIGTGSLTCLLAQFAATFPPLSTHAPLLSGLFAAHAIVITMLIGRAFHRLFPPAMSIALTPFLVNVHPWFFLYVPCMMAYFIFIAWIMRNHPAYKNMDLKYL